MGVIYQMDEARISLATARRLAIDAQGFGGRGRLPQGKEGVARTVERLGYVQIDTIAVVERAHHHTLWSRRPDYSPQMLDDLQARDRRIFEYWTHAAAFLPMRDYRFSLPRMKAYAASSRIHDFLQTNSSVVRQIISRIRSEGPLGSSDFEAEAGKQRGSWWDWKPAKTALEFLFWTGQLMVSHRRGFERRYDLTERVLPPGTDTHLPSAEESARFLVRRTLGGLGVSSFQHWSLRRTPGLEEALRDLQATGEIVALRIEGHGTTPHFALAPALRSAAGGRRPAPQVHILSPFDNLVIWRDPLKRLFDFDYKLECYTPAPQRRYGYFCLPILWGQQFVGRLDAKANRAQKILGVRALVFEPGFSGFEELLPPLAAKLGEFAVFNGCHRVRIEQATPRKTLAPLTKALREWQDLATV